jgi:hypothetical protein
MRSGKTIAAFMTALPRACGTYPLSAIDTREFKQWHRALGSAKTSHVAAAHAYMAQLRTLINHGFFLLEGPDRIECFRMGQILSKLKFPQPAPRNEVLSAEQANAIRAHAHEIGWHSIALAQAFQFELLLRQKDVIGEYGCRRRNPANALETWKGQKWLRGLIWSEIDRRPHPASRHVQATEDDRNRPEARADGHGRTEATTPADAMPHDPCIICETSAMPWTPSEFRRKWRIVADYAGIPANVKNMDSRAGGITEATEAGADLEHVKHAATHSNIAMTQRYSRERDGQDCRRPRRSARRIAAEQAPSHDRRASQPITGGAS